MIYLTGDMSGKQGIDRLNPQNFPGIRSQTNLDYVFALGDCGFSWDNSPDELLFIARMKSKPFTLFFIDGDNNNPDTLNKFPVKNLFGGIAHQISDNIFYLRKGEIYTIRTKKILVMGGAADPNHYDEGVKNSCITDEDIDNALYNIRKKTKDGVVNAVVSYCAPHFVEKQFSDYFLPSESSLQLDKLANQLNGQYSWYFGSPPIRYDLWTDSHGRKYQGVYNSIIRIS